MPQLVKKRRSGWALLATGALIASILAVGATPTGAAEIKAGDDNKAEPSVEATFSACVGDANDDAGFTDTAGLGAEDAINCLAYYGITTGKTATTFDPNSNVTRSQMALFLYRAADVAGLDLMGGDMTASFGDIADQGAERSNAINALARNGILAGRTSMAFEPDADITRAEMAVALVGFLRHGAPSLFHQSGANKGQLIIDPDNLDHFADARLATPRAVDTAISYIYELGVTTGYGDATYRPDDTVPRKNMASFITRALAHTNTRPAGMSVQSDDGTLTVSIRDADFEPIANESVDAFYVSDAKVDRAFDSDGECRSIVTSVDRGDECEIDFLDPATDADGNAQLEQLTGEAVGKGVTVWVWTGAIGDEVDDGTELVEFKQEPVVNPTAATRTKISPDQAKTPMARFGSAVEFTVQLQQTDEREAGEADDLTKNTTVGTDGDGSAEYSLTVEVYQGQLTGYSNDGTTITVTPATSGLVSRSVAETLKTDSDGKATFSLTTTDPRAASDMDFRTVVYTLTSGKNAPGTVVDDPETPGSDESAEKIMTGFVVFSEAPSKVTSVKVDPLNSYVEAPRLGRSAANGVIVTVRDQYGKPMRNQKITLMSSLNLPDADPVTVLGGERSTTRTGTVRITFSHTATEPAVEKITANWNGDLPGATDSGCYDADTNDDGLDRCGAADIYWVLRTPQPSADGEGADTDGFPIVAGDLDDNEIVVDQDDTVGPPVIAWVVRYDDNDILRLNGEYVEIDEFETALAKVLDPDNPDVRTNSGTLDWESYDHDDEDDRALFDLTVPASS